MPLESSAADLRVVATADEESVRRHSLEPQELGKPVWEEGGADLIPPLIMTGSNNAF